MGAANKALAVRSWTARRVLVPALAAIFCVVCPGAGSAGERPVTSGGIAVFVSIEPQAYFVKRIGGGHVTVDVLVGAGRSPHTYEPTPRQMAALARSRVYFTVGVPIERSIVPKVVRMNPALAVVDTTQGIEFLPADTGGTHEDGKGEAGHLHAEGGPDPHVWLDPRRVKIMAGTITRALEAIDPAHARAYRANLDTFRADLDRLDAELAETFTPLRGSKVYVYHGAFGYLAHAYGFTQVPVEIGGKEPSARELARLIEKARAEGVRVIFVQPQFSRRKAEVVAAQIGGAVVAINPLPADYMTEMRRMARSMRDAAALTRR